jgi:hypothetical protein
MTASMARSHLLTRHMRLLVEGLLAIGGGLVPMRLCSRDGAYREGSQARNHARGVGDVHGPDWTAWERWRKWPPRPRWPLRTSWTPYTGITVDLEVLCRACLDGDHV